MNFYNSTVESQSGFSLIELMIALAIASILAAIGIPSYQAYTQRSVIPEATTQLHMLKLQLEQYYQDNRRYSATGTDADCGIAIPAGKIFDYRCVTTNAGQGYTLKAIGVDNQIMKGFVYALDEKGVESTETLPSGWGVAPQKCWVVKKNMVCD